jgi:hypothetical protein
LLVTQSGTYRLVLLIATTGSAWKHDYIDLLHTVVEQALRSKGMTYSQILALDQKLRNHPVPSSLTWPETQEEAMAKASISPQVAMQCLMRLNLQESGVYSFALR